MMKDLFTFTHLIHRHDKHFCSIDSVVAERIVYAASLECERIKMDPKEWVLFEYDNWIKSYNTQSNPLKPE